MLLIALLIPVFIGLAIFKILSHKSSYKNISYYLYIVLAIALGAGICSYLYFVCLWLFGIPLISILFELALFTALILWRKKWSVYFMEVKSFNNKVLIFNGVCIILFVICFINTLVYFIPFAQQNPHGLWDAIAIWNLKARFLYLGGNCWQAMFSTMIPWSHPDYPLFLPGFIAHSWMLMKTNETSAAIAAFAYFTLGTGAVLFLSLSHFKGIAQGLVAGLMLLCTPGIINQGTSQYADVTLGFFFLASFVCLTLADEAGTKGHFLLLIAGLFAGFAAWTKNEGIPFFLAVLFSRVLMFILKPSKMNVKTISYFVIGGLPIIILIFLYKHFLTPANDIMAGQKGHVMEKLKDFSRYQMIFSYIRNKGMVFGEWTTPPHLWILVLLLLFGFQLKKSFQISVICSTFAFILIMASYFFIYVTTPYDLAWHLENSLNRLLIQLFPSFLFLYFIALRPFDESLLSLEIMKGKKPLAKFVKKKRVPAK